MDPEAFLDLANQVTKLKMYPYFDLAHAALCCLAVRDDLASGKSCHPVSILGCLYILLHSRVSSLLQEAPAVPLGVLHARHLRWGHPRQPPPR